jgi:cell division septum initiation protein DivIVA
MDLAVAMRSDGNRWFLKYIDKFLDDIENDYATCDSQVAGFLQQLKKVDDWLNRVVRHERMISIDRSSKDSVLSEEEESDACERVRRGRYMGHS